MHIILRGAARAAAVLLPIAAAGALVMAARGTAQGPVPRDGEAPAVPARIVTIEPAEFLPRVTGYGSVEPARTWRAVARIEGTVAWMAEGLENGRIVEAGAPLLRLDDTDIRLALAQIDADLATLGIRERTLRDSLDIQERELALTEAERARQAELAGRGAASRSAVDAAEGAVLAALGRLQTTRNAIDINAAERASLEARRAVVARDLGYVEIAAPFALRLGAVAAETGQFVGRGATLFEGDGLEAVEIAAQFPIGRLRPLVMGREEAGPVGLEALVTLRAPDHGVVWTGRVDRVGEAIGARTQSAAVIVRVEEPITLARPGERPPLRRGAFVEVELRGEARSVPGIVPAEALHDGQLYVLDADNRLDIVPAQVAARQGSLVILGEGLALGTRVVVSDLIPAVPGMAIAPRPDTTLAARLRAEAAGGETVQ
jgi:multidrug efflux pump subunit AcrA (membrane-fusion protein)